MNTRSPAGSVLGLFFSVPWLILVLTSVLVVEGRSQPFVRLPASLPRTYPSTSSWADADADGDMDVLLDDLVDANTEEPRLYRNDGGGAFVRSALPMTRHSYYGFSHHWEDDNRDGRVDLLLTGSDEAGSPVLKSLLGAEGGRFLDSGVRLGGEPLLWADLDNDGRLDVVAITRYAPGSSWVYWQETSTSYAVTTPPFPAYVGSVSAGDADADGDLDLLLRTASSGLTRLYRNDGRRRFVDIGTDLRLAGDTGSAWADLDADGDLDLVTAGTGADGIQVPKVYRNVGGMRFVDAHPGLARSSPDTVRWADFDQDGLTDVLLVGARSPVGGQVFTDQRIRLFRNEGGGSFAALNVSFPDFVAGGADAMDLEGDGDVDFAVWGQDARLGETPARRLYRNDRERPAGGPPSPEALASEPAGRRVTLRWSGAAGVSFNLRAGTRPGAADLVSPLVAPDNRRLVPGIGNAQVSKQWYLVDLPVGTYFWSVQAVDASFRASPFAPEAQFVVKEDPHPPPPTVSDLPHLFVDEDGAPPPVVFTVGPEASAEGLWVSVDADNVTLTPLGLMRLTGTGVERVLAITLAADQAGVSLVTVRVADAFGQSTNKSFLVTVNAVNDPPVLGAIPNLLTYANNPPLLVPLEIADVETAAARLVLTPTTSNPGLVSTSAIERVLVSKTEEMLRILPASNQVGQAVIGLALSDGEATVERAFVVQVLPRLFEPGTNRLVYLASGTASWADFDRDGDLDPLLFGITNSFGGSTTLLYRNAGAGLFNNSGLALPTPPGGTAAWSDLDRDGDPDLVLLSSQGAVVMRNDGGTNFATSWSTAGLAMTSPAIACGDLDADGDPDVVASGFGTQGTPSLRVWRNQSGAFLLVPGPNPAVVGNLALGDYDEDGWLDLAVSGTGANGRGTNIVFRGVGDARFERAPVAFGGAGTGPVGWNDVDGDGRLDLWRVDRVGVVGTLDVHRNLGGELAAPRSWPINAWLWADGDGDGDLDVLAEQVVEATAEGGFPRPPLRGARRFTIWHQDSALGFTPLGNVLAESGASYGAVADADEDGDLDLLAAYEPPPPGGRDWVVSGLGTRLFANLGAKPNPPPGPPRDLRAQVESNTVVLAWTVATDLNQTAALTYNVRVGTRPGGGDVVSPLALGSGHRLVVAAGNAGLATRLFLTNLMGESFFWSVQAVDNGFAGGPFAPEERFDIHQAGNQPPEIGLIPDQTVEEEGTVEVPLRVTDDRTAADDVRLRAIPGDPFLVPVSGLSFIGSGTDRTLRVTPATNQAGSTTIRVQATDAVGATGERSFTLTVQGRNDPPWLSAIPDQAIDYSADPFDIPFIVSDPDTPADRLRLSAVSSDPSLVPPENVIFRGTNNDRTATVRAGSAVEGEVNLTFTATDPEGASASRTFRVVLRNLGFRLMPTPFGGVRYGSMAWGDYDNDGDLDLALAGQGLNQTALYRNEGGGRFGKADTDLPNVDGGGVEWGDFDNDGDLDLLIHGRGLWAGGLVARFYRNLGDGRLEAADLGFPGRYGPAAWGDLDNDGDPDLVSTGEDFAGTTGGVVYRNDAGRYVSPGIALPGAYGTVDMIQDVDQNGVLDLVVRRLGPFSWQDAVFLNDGNLHFSEAPPPWPGSALAWADFNQDGLPDALECTGTRQDLRVWLGGRSVWGTPIRTNFTPDGVAVADCDNDGWVDVFCAGYEGDFVYQTRLFRSRGGGEWDPVTLPAPDLAFCTAAWADFDNDGDVDLLLNGQWNQPSSTTYVTQLYRNDRPVPNPSPQAPTGLRAWHTLEGLVLEWDAAQDANQPYGLTYNVRVGTSSGAGDVLAPMARSDGFRLVARPGNAGWRTRKLLRLPPSAAGYYWSVQAIDNAFAGSPFAPELRVGVGTPPTLEPVTDQTMMEDTMLEVPLLLGDPDGEVAAAQVRVTVDNDLLLPPGSLVLAGAGGTRSLTIDPAPDRNGSSELLVTVTDEAGGRVSRSFSITVLPASDPPRAVTRRLTLAEDSGAEFTLEASDPDGEPLVYAILREPRHGALLGTPPHLAYRPVPDFFGEDGLRFRVEDPSGLASEATIAFDVTPVPDAPEFGLSARFLSDRTAVFTIRGEPYQVYLLELSFDLRTWTPLQSLWAADGVITFSSQSPAPGAAHFYRARNP